MAPSSLPAPCPPRATRRQVPAEYGGPSTVPMEELPQMRALSAFVAELRAGGNPHARVARERPQP
jgi:hypothetical protein